MTSSANRDAVEKLGRISDRELKRARKRGKPKPVTVQCSDCKETSKVSRSALLNRTRLRCQRCGGPMNRANEA
jgi:ribosomal protein S27E